MHAAPVTPLRPMTDSLQRFVGMSRSLTRVPAFPAVSFHMLSLVQDLISILMVDVVCRELPFLKHSQDFQASYLLFQKCVHEVHTILFFHSK